MNRITETVKHLLIINVIMFVATLVIGEARMFDLFALHYPENGIFKPWQIVTHMFMHGGFTHILFNMFALWMFGTAVEQRLGSKKFLILYFAAGLGAVLFQLGFYYFEYSQIVPELQASGVSTEALMDIFRTGKWNFPTTALQVEQINDAFQVYNATMVGASGCIMGVLVAFGILNPNAELMLIFLPIPIKAKYFIPLLVGYDIVSGFLGSPSVFGMNIAHWAHVGGAVVGLIVMQFLKKNTFNKYRID
ncbi:rhomboid family intramembrane serine protease [Lacinutrix venerupis]|uniref:Rhomboid family intramembrane serine protease n=1 Tax=Lacinutrix venerupis TaxID=1486034 RepID=A0AAC9PXD2_9FLAO|nr:rhomboid family intramembrane serine protease [Lacinutrix venerupis]APY00790.1 rhomboid family intramembrane serine protease [Lacinutrix venerupis]